MEQSRYLIDTNVVIDYLSNKLPPLGMALMNEVLDLNPNVSIVTKIEVLGFNTSVEHSLLLENFMDDINVIDLTSFIADQTIAIRKSNKTKLPDAIIAATAVVNELTLITRNTADFKNITGLNLLDPYKQQE